ncbi:MAG: hypothetical protein LBD42_05130 [Desulfovibrio sp.]|jgi:hypothetical protein|nr:hypothetical protein [Desulfovibrio sp.]
MIASFFEGRIRLRASALKKEEHMSMALAFIRAQAGVRNVTPNIRTGSILVEYAPDKLSRESIESALESFAAMCAPQRKSPFPAAYRDSGALLCALGLTFASLIFDKRVHALCGTVFTALSALHYAARR